MSDGDSHDRPRGGPSKTMALPEAFDQLRDHLGNGASSSTVETSAPQSKSKRKNSASVRYAGELAKPIIESFSDDTQTSHQYYSPQRRAKLKALFEWYSIDPADQEAFAKLAIALALDHVPGMNVRPAPKKRGPHRSWQDGLNVKLLRAVEDLRDKNEGMTIKEAIQTLRKSRGWSCYTQQNLEVRHREARRIEEGHRRLYREWKENPGGFEIALLKAFAVDLDKHFEQLRSEGFKIDD